MTRDYETDSEVAYLVNTYDWYFLPVMNPDGYEFAYYGVRQLCVNTSHLPWKVYFCAIPKGTEIDCVRVAVPTAGEKIAVRMKIPPA